MSKFHSLTVAKVERETRDAIVVTFAVPEDLREAFRFEPGQHVTLRAVIGGEDLRRSYSICAPAGAPLRIAIKRAPGGAFSTWANDALRPGMTLDVVPPMGHFGVAAEPDRARHHLAFAAGSGITPPVSIIGTALASEP
ncbi:MAG TPA: FAD-binding oxidoreductase, partial [Casimicrobiaceae bacterium]|nr:FAD-binding oxidoreductase [Casimicrobiaceae bacterium]